MTSPSFHYTSHPGDLFRDTSVVELPDPETNLEDFLVWFLDCYQTDSRVTYFDDLHKLLHNEFHNEEDKIAFMEEIGYLSDREILEEIRNTETILKNEAMRNFYELVRERKVVIVDGSEK